MIREESVSFGDLRDVLKDLTHLWSVIRLYIRCIGLPYAKGKADRVSGDFFDLLFGGGGIGLHLIVVSDARNRTLCCLG